MINLLVSALFGALAAICVIVVLERSNSLMHHDEFHEVIDDIYSQLAKQEKCVEVLTRCEQANDNIFENLNYTTEGLLNRVNELNNVVNSYRQFTLTKWNDICHAVDDEEMIGQYDD